MSIIHLSWPFVSIVVLTQCCSVNAANQYCTFHPQHALCGDQGFASSCGKIIRDNLKSEEVEQILKLHNELRAKVANGLEVSGALGPQPPASNMRQMTWSNELALIAQSHTNKCSFSHDCANCRRTVDYLVGQNMFMTTSSQAIQLDAREAVMDFYNEVKMFNREGVASYVSDPDTGHYSQLVWAESHHLGCGYVYYKDSTNYKEILTCNYGPTGNVEKQPVYKNGRSCSSCPDGTSCSADFNGLCSSAGATAKGTLVIMFVLALVSSAKAFI